MSQHANGILAGLFERTLEEYWKDPVRQVTRSKRTVEIVVDESYAAYEMFAAWLQEPTSDFKALEDELFYVKHTLDSALVDEWMEFFQNRSFAEGITWLIMGLQRNPRVGEEIFARWSLEMDISDANKAQVSAAARPRRK